MGGRGTNSSAVGVDTGKYFDMDMGAQVALFRQVADSVDPALNAAFQNYTSGYFGGSSKNAFDKQNGLSDFIDSDASAGLHIKNSPTLYRGGTLTDEEYQNLKVGGTLDAMDSKNQLTSWTDREMVAHMYAEESKNTWGQGGSNPHDVVIVDTSSTTDGIVNPYTYPANEVLRSRSVSYTITKIVDESQYKAPIGREREATNDSYKAPVTYIFVKSKKH